MAKKRQPKTIRAQGVTDAVLAVLRTGTYPPDQDITARGMLQAVRQLRPGFSTEQLPAITMALCAAERSGLLRLVDGRKGKRKVWRTMPGLVPRLQRPAGFNAEQAGVTPARSIEVAVPLSAVQQYLPPGEPVLTRPQYELLREALLAVQTEGRYRISAAVFMSATHMGRDSEEFGSALLQLLKGHGLVLIYVPGTGGSYSDSLEMRWADDISQLVPVCPACHTVMPDGVLLCPACGAPTEREMVAGLIEGLRQRRERSRAVREDLQLQTGTEEVVTGGNAGGGKTDLHRRLLEGRWADEQE